MKRRGLLFQLIGSGTAQTGSLRTGSICKSDEKNQQNTKSTSTHRQLRGKRKREENEMSVDVGQSMTAMARRGEKVARKRAGRGGEKNKRRCCAQRRWPANAMTAGCQSQRRMKWDIKEVRNGRDEERGKRSIERSGRNITNLQMWRGDQ